MLHYLQSLLDSRFLSPHGICLLWNPELIWTHVISDALIGTAYFSIPIALAYFMSKRRDLAFSWVFGCFAAFILACGATHFFSIWTLWNPDYGPEALVKMATAAVSVMTAILLWQLLPKALALPSPVQLREINSVLTQRVVERDEALEALRRESEQRLRAEEQVRQAQKMEAVGQLTGGMAHDFNNLLTVIVGNLHRAQRLSGPGADGAQAALANALVGAERAAALTDRLLAFARKQPLQPAEIDLNALVGDVAELLKRTLGPQVEFDIVLACDLWPVHVDANQTENALLNLALNARDAMPEGGRLTIRTRNLPADAGPHGVAPGDSVAIEVSDTGTGMTPEVLERAFEPFYTTKPLGEGTGLGLSQVYGFARQSGGTAVIESVVGIGTTISVIFPRTAAITPAAMSEDAA